MKIRILFFVFISTFFPAFLLQADVVVLKDGTTITGEVVGETSESVTIEYQATKTIKDQKTISKLEIDRVEKISPDEKAFQELGSLETPANVVDTAFYDKLVRNKLPDFIAKYPDSGRNAQACERLKTLQEERARVEKGDRRFDSVWITAAEIAADPYQAGAMVQHLRVKESASAGNPVESLRAYELLEKNYPGSAVMPDAVGLALKQLDLLQSQVQLAKVNGVIELKRISNAIATARADEAKIMKGDLERDANLAKEVAKAAGADGTKFFPVFQKNKEALDALQAIITAERARLLQFQTTTMRQSISAAKEGLQMVHKEQLREAREQLALSQKIWPANHDNIQLKNAIDRAESAQASKGAIAAQEAAQEAKEKAARAAKQAAKEAELKAQNDKIKAEAEAKIRAEAEAKKAASEKESAPPASLNPADVSDKIEKRNEILEVLEK